LVSTTINTITEEKVFVWNVTYL